MKLTRSEVIAKNKALAPINQRWCPKCSTAQPLDAFNRGKGYCRDCKQAHKRIWATKNSDRVAEYNRKWQQDNADRHREAVDRWRAANRDYVAQYSREWREANPDYYREYQQKYLNEGGRQVKPRTDTPAYITAHFRVRAAKGRASNYDCALDCGGEAREWAYSNCCPDELTDDKGQRYCVHSDCYEPLCSPCHKRKDRAAALEAQDKTA